MEPDTPSRSPEAEALRERYDLAEGVVDREWSQFQRVNNAGGPAECQGNLPMFRQMRLSQFLTWPVPLLRGYAEDLADAETTGRNLLTEKYARMMATTEPDRYAREIAPLLPRLPEDRLARQDEIVTVQLAWARDFHARYPRLGAGMRVLTSDQDTLATTSFETYLRGELATYSDRTLTLYRALIDSLVTGGDNLTEQTVRYTVLLAGFADLDEAEAAQG